MTIQLAVSQQERCTLNNRIWDEDEASEEFALDPVKVSIARLSAVDIHRMNRLDLIDLVAFSELLFLSPEKLQHLRFMDQAELKMLAFLSRRSCRHLVNSSYIKWGGRAPFPSAA